MSNGLEVAAVEKGSIAEELEIAPGDKILSVNGQTVNDIIDFQYLTSDEEFTLWVDKGEEEIWELAIEREPGEILGISFKEISTEGLKLCQNNCVFCFVAQMPENMRPSLYDKDDDYRLSLTQGSFITLSNLQESDLEKIIALHLSPLYISVHVWNPEKRLLMMKNPRAMELPRQLKRLAAAGITLHTQIVLVPDYNDGDYLAETVNELAQLYPAVQSIAVVPVGLTRFRERLTPLRAFTADEVGKLLVWGESMQQEFRAQTGKNLVYFSDEFYVLAHHQFPPLASYDELAQLENGVGMTSKFKAEVAESWGNLPEKINLRQVHIITGTSAHPFFTKLASELEERISGLSITVHRIVNRFFGPTVTVAGLLTAGDIADQTGDLKGETFLIPRVMLKADQDIFLDDRPVEWLEKHLNGKAVVVENEGGSFLDGILGAKCCPTDKVGNSFE